MRAPATRQRGWGPLLATALAVALLATGMRPRRGAGADSSLPRQEASSKPVETPSALPGASWKKILVGTYNQIFEDRVTSLAGGVAYFILLAIFPAIAALVAVYGLFADPATISQNVKSLSNVLPGGAIEVVNDQIGRIVAQGRGTLSLAFALGLVVSLWSANSGMKAL